MCIRDRHRTTNAVVGWHHKEANPTFGHQQYVYENGLQRGRKEEEKKVRQDGRKDSSKSGVGRC